MPVKACQSGGRPGLKWGDRGKCYAYDPGDEDGREEARRRALAQGVAIGDIGEEEAKAAGCRAGERRKKRKQRRSLIKKMVIVERT